MNIKNIITAALLLLAIDAGGLALWILSGQMPHDGFFLGMITRSLLMVLI